MRGFLFILSVILTIYGFTVDRFQKRQEDVYDGGLGQAGITYCWTNKQQDSLHATGKRWIKEQHSKLRRRLARNFGVKSNDACSCSVSSFSLFFLLFLAGDLEVNLGPMTTSSNSRLQNAVIELATMIATGSQKFPNFRHSV